MGDVVGDALLEDEELELVARGEVDSSGKFCTFVNLPGFYMSVEMDHTWPGCNINVDFSASSRWTSKIVVALGLMTPTMP